MIASPRADPNPFIRGEKRLVVCVDDEPSILSGLRRALRKEPYELRTVGTPREALELVERGGVSLIISDHRMPGMYGADLLDAVRQRSPRTVRVILTAFPGSSLVSHGLANGIDWLISKPWNDEALRLTVRQLLADQGTDGDAPGKESERCSRIRREIVERLGYVPPLLESAAEAPETLEGLWVQTRTAYLDSPLSRLFQETLFAYLSRFCDSPYCLVFHACALRTLGLSGAEIHALLEEPPPAVEIDVASHLAVLASTPGPIERWPGSGTPLARALLRCTVAFFQSGSSAGRCRAELGRVLGPPSYSRLTALLAYVRTCHAWTEAHPELSPRHDLAVVEQLEILVREEPRLREFFDSHPERVRRERRKVEDKLLEVIAGLRKREAALQKTQDHLETRIQDRTSELSRVNEELRKDIAERKRAEEERDRLSVQLLQGQKLQAIGQLSAGIAHEINNPVGYILSNLSTIREYLDDLTRLLGAALETSLSVGPEDPVRQGLDRLRREIDADFVLEDFRKAVDETRQGAERIRDIVKSLKEFSHVDDGDLKPADLNQCLENSLRICWNELKYSAQVQRDFGSLPPVLCHAPRLGQVFVNLLVNAAQAIGGKGEISVSTRAEGSEAVVRIRDSGCGIPEDMLPKIFDPFFTTKPVGKGTGLGLHVAYKIVTAHGGRIEVRSEVGKGSEFTVRLPLSGPGSK